MLQSKYEYAPKVLNCASLLLSMGLYFYTDFNFNGREFSF